MTKEEAQNVFYDATVAGWRVGVSTPPHVNGIKWHAKHMDYSPWHEPYVPQSEKPFTKTTRTETYIGNFASAEALAIELEALLFSDRVDRWAQEL